MEENNLTNPNNIGSNESKMAMVDYEDVQFLNDDELDSSTNMDDNEMPSNVGAMDNIFDELITQTPHDCTHFHTCDAPGPEFPHTHTCVHVHTKKISSPNDEDGHDPDNFGEPSGRKRGWERGGNREAVRKYRQKKKAYTASLANELVKLRTLNQQLMQRLRSRVTIENEVGRLKCLLVDLRGRIEGEIGSFPYQKPVLCDTPCGDPRGLRNRVAGEDLALSAQNVNGMATLGCPPSFC